MTLQRRKQPWPRRLFDGVAQAELAECAAAPHVDLARGGHGAAVAVAQRHELERYACKRLHCTWFRVVGTTVGVAQATVLAATPRVHTRTVSPNPAHTAEGLLAAHRLPKTRSNSC